MRGLDLVQAVQHPGEHAGRFGADPLGVLLAELLPLLVSDGRVDKRQALALLMAQVGVERGGQGVGQVAKALGPAGRVGEGGVDGMDEWVDGGVLGGGRRSWRRPPGRCGLAHGAGPRGRPTSWSCRAGNPYWCSSSCCPFQSFGFPRGRSGTHAPSDKTGGPAVTMVTEAPRLTLGEPSSDGGDRGGPRCKLDRSSVSAEGRAF